MRFKDRSSSMGTLSMSDLLLSEPGVRHSDSDYGAQAAGLLLALCHWRACQQQALRDPRSILVGEW